VLPRKDGCRLSVKNSELQVGGRVPLRESGGGVGEKNGFREDDVENTVYFSF
jgi:hypothetical protein